MEVETSLGTETQSTVTPKADGTAAEVTTQSVLGLTADAVKKAPEGTTEAKPAEKTAEGEQKPEAKPEGEKTPEAEKPKAEDLGEFKADDPAVVSKFDAAYYTPEGNLNLAALSAEHWANEGSLKDSTYDYLANRLGVSKEDVKRLEAGVRREADATLAERAAEAHKLAGGKEAYDAAFEWGKTGLTESQRNRFNELAQKGGEEFEDAVLALMSRYRGANPEAAVSGQKLPNLPQRPQRASSPQRDATVGSRQVAAVQTPGAAPEVQPFADQKEYLQALREAGDDPRKRAAVRARQRVSKLA